MVSAKKILIRVYNKSLYYLYKIKLIFLNLDIKVMSVSQTIKCMKKGMSIVRFGDGEFRLIKGHDICFQMAERNLSCKLYNALTSVNVSGLLVCLPETVDNLDFCRKSSKIGWTIHLGRSAGILKKACSKDVTYGNSFVSRPYMIYEDKSQCDEWFRELKDLFSNREIVLVEGKTTRMGVGNDLFSQAKSVERILCPSQNAYDKYDEILSSVLEESKEKTILISVGPTSKVLACELHKMGYLVWDIGHLDSEYEWYLNHAKDKIEIGNKHTAESLCDNSIGECFDEDYLKSIIKEIK